MNENTGRRVNKGRKTQKDKVREERKESRKRVIEVERDEVTEGRKIGKKKMIEQMDWRKKVKKEKKEVYDQEEESKGK